MRLRLPFSSFGSKVPQEQPNGAAVYATTACKRFNHPEFQVRVSNSVVPTEDLNWFLRFLEQRVADGERFRGGESLQVGWMLTMLEEGPAGYLRVMEPDMKVVPVKFTDAIDSTLMHLRHQKDMVQSFSPQVDPDFPSLRQSAVVHVNYKTASRILLTRGPVQDTDSGWWLTDLDDNAGSQDPTRLFKTSLYQLGVDRPDLVKFFAVPSGLQVAVDNTFIGVLGPDGELKQIPGSYLSELNRHRQQRSN